MDYCEFVLKRNKSVVPWLLLRSFRSRFSPVFYICAVASRIFQFDFVKTIAVWFLKNLTKEELYRVARLFVKEELGKRRIEKVFSLLTRYNGSRVILLSSSVDPVVHAIAETLNAEYASTRLQYNGEVCSGKIEFEMKGKKWEVFKERFKNNKDQLLVISDNFSDKDIMENADYKYAVVYNRKQTHFWEQYEVTIIKANE